MHHCCISFCLWKSVASFSIPFAFPNVRETNVVPPEIQKNGDITNPEQLSFRQNRLAKFQTQLFPDNDGEKKCVVHEKMRGRMHAYNFFLKCM